jgi:type VI secretion system protein ImpK
MKLELWNKIIALRGDIGMLLERTLYLQSTTQAGERAVPDQIDEETLLRLRGELRTKLDTLKDNLLKELTENEVYLVMFPMVLLCDEMVMKRLPKQQQTLWFLLQSELFQINYGGDVFYEFVDERLAKPDTPSIVFEVLFYCLSSGFVGKFGVEAGKVQRYKGLLSERIPGAFSPTRKKRRRREARDKEPQEAVVTPPTTPEPPPAPRSPAWYYLATLGVLLVAVFGIFALSNL